MTALRTNVANAFETTLSSSLGVGATTINVVDTSGSPAVPFYLTLEPASDAKREIVLVTGKTSTTFTLASSANRGLDGTTDTAHDSGASVKVVPVAAVITDLHDRIDDVADAYTPGGTDVAVADGGTGASTAAAARTNMAVVGNAGGDTITASGAAVKGLVVKGAASQTANLTEWQDSAGAVVASVGANGGLTGLSLSANAVSIFDPTNETTNTTKVFVNNGTATVRPLVVRGAASQTANLQEWQNSAGAALAAITAGGGLVTTGDLDLKSQTVAGTAGSQFGFINVTINGTALKLPVYNP